MRNSLVLEELAHQLDRRALARQLREPLLLERVVVLLEPRHLRGGYASGVREWLRAGGGYASAGQRVVALLEVVTRGVVAGGLLFSHTPPGPWCPWR